MSPWPSAHVDTFCRDHLPPVEQWPELLFALPELQYPARLNCAQALLGQPVADLGAARRCLVWPGGSWSYVELARNANMIARLLVEDYGLVPGNRVLLRGPNNPWLVACWFAVLKAGGVVVNTMPLLRAAELKPICEIAQVNLALCDYRFTDALTVAAPELRIISYGGDRADDLTAQIALKDWWFDAVPTAADDVALLAFTSGTTGWPKATAHFHRDVLVF